MKTTALLTIAIPTYNRQQTLVKNLEKLLSQLTDECELLIIDNCSSNPVEDYLKGTFLANDNNFKKIRVVRNSSNIGLSANFVRCFEFATSKWLWILSDDDPVVENALEIVLRHIKQYADVALLTYSTPIFVRKKEFSIQGIHEFLDKLDNFERILFISGSIYNASMMQKHISAGYYFSYSMAPHLAILFSSLAEDGKGIFLTEEIVKWDPTPVNERWNALIIILRLYSLIEHPSLSFEDKKKLAVHLDKNFTRKYLALLIGVVISLNSSEIPIDMKRQLKLYFIEIGRRLRCARTFSFPKKIVIYLLIKSVFFPGLIMPLLKFSHRMFKIKRSWASFELPSFTNRL